MKSFSFFLSILFPFTAQLKESIPYFCNYMNVRFRFKDDAISLEDLDKVMKDGLGMRYAFMGPMETIHLNAEGWT